MPKTYTHKETHPSISFHFQTPKMKYKETILSNCASKIFMGEAVPEELAWWEKEFTLRRVWTYSNSMDMNKLE